MPAKWPENLKNARAGKLMVWNLGNTAAAPDGRPRSIVVSSRHKGGQNLARFDNKEFDSIYKQIRIIPDGPERLALFFEAQADCSLRMRRTSTTCTAS